MKTSDELIKGQRETIDSNTDEATQDFGSTGNSEDTAIKIIRVFANASIEPETVLIRILNIINDFKR